MGAIGLPASPATGTSAGARGSKRLLPVCTLPVTISVTKRPFVTYQGDWRSTEVSFSSIRALSMYSTRRSADGDSAYGSFATAKGTGPHSHERVAAPAANGSSALDQSL